MTNIVIFGAPGAGKGTQAGMLAQRFGLNHLSTGDVIRAEICAATPLGLAVREAISRGELAPDHVAVDIIAGYMLSHCDCGGNIFDGFPRTIPQAEALDEILAGHGLGIDAMFELVVPEEDLVQRILLRGVTSGRDDDVCEDVIRNRIEIYNAQTADVAHYYRRQGKYNAIDGRGTIAETFDALCRGIEGLVEE